MCPIVQTPRDGRGDRIFPITLQTFPKQLPPKTTTQDSYLKAMILIDLEGIWIVSIGVKEKPSTKGA
jgi:hypothetical protein